MCSFRKIYYFCRVKEYAFCMPYASDLLKVKQTGFSLAAGRLLISVPYYNDAFFNRSVVLLTDYDAEMCTGLIINRRLPYRVRDLVDGLRVDAPMFLGGPVMPWALFLLHDIENNAASSRIVPKVYVGYDQSLLTQIESNAMASGNCKFLMGYAGWSPGQLEDEIGKNMWVIGNPTPELVFHKEPESVWSESVRILGPDYEHWLRIPKYINLN